MTMRWWLSQICNVIGYGIFIFAMYRKRKEKMLYTDAISRGFFVTGWIFLSSVNGVFHSLFGFVRAVAFRKLKKKGYIITAFIVMTIVIMIMYGLTFTGISTILFMLSAISNLCGSAFGNEQGVRIGVIIASLFNIFSFCMLSNYAGAVGEIFVFITTVIAYFTNKVDASYCNPQKSQNGA